MMESDQEQSFCFSYLEEDLHSACANSLFVEDASFTDLSQELDIYCEPAVGEGNGKPLVITGIKGAGKSTALANWSARRKANAPSTGRRLDYAEFIFHHAIGCSRLSTQVTHLLRRLVNGLIVHFELKETMDLADEKLPWILPRLLERASKKGRVIIVIGGGLQHICSNDKDYGLKWLPLRLPANVKMILSAATPTDVPNNDESTSDHSKKLKAKIQQTWDEIQRRKWPMLPLEHLQDDAVVTFVERYLTSISTQDNLSGVRAQVIETISSHPLANNPLFITFMLRGIFHAISLGYNVNKCLVTWMSCQNAESLYETMLSLFESGTMRRNSLSRSDITPLGSLLGDSFSLLFVARHGLHENELFELLDRVRQQSRWNSETKGTVVPIKLKILKMLMQKKNRLIDVFRSFDTDGNGTLSHEEFYSGMERLDIDVSHSEITQLINEVDNNGDGEIDYRETLDHFERLARSYSHGKRRISIFGKDAMSTDSSSLTNQHKQNLISTLKCAGVSCLDTKTGSVLTLPFENTALRDVIWKKYIKDETKESQSRTFIIEYFSKKQPSLRYCEELPWHLKKVRAWPELKKILVDLRTLDIMFNSSELKAELFNYLRILSIGGKIRFDIVNEYNHSMQQWHQYNNPSSRHISMMSSFIADVMAWFDTGISGLTGLPPFMRERIPDEYLQKIGVGKRIDLSGSGSRQHQSSQLNHIKSEAQYFFNRWIWIQFPWLALASMECNRNVRQLKADSRDAGNNEIKPSLNQTLKLRDKAMIHARISDPSSTLLKLDKIESSEPKKRLPTAIPFSAGTTWESHKELGAMSVATDSSLDNAAKMRQLQDLKSIHDSLIVEVSAKKNQLTELKSSQQMRQVGVSRSHGRIADGQASLRALQSRLYQLDDLIDAANEVDFTYQSILLALHDCDPAKNSQHIQLEQQVMLSRQQIADLKRERGSINKEIENIEAKSKKMSEMVKTVVQERQMIKPLLESLHARATEELERKKTARLSSFDPSAFSRRVRIEGKIAKRRENKLRRKQSMWNSTMGGFEAREIQKAVSLHPMERLACAAGTRDPSVITKLLNGSEAQQLRMRQERGEAKLSEQLEKLKSLQSQIKVVQLADSGTSKIISTAAVDESIMNSEAALSSKQKRLDSMTQLVQNVSLAIVNLSAMVESLEEDKSLNDFAQFTMEAGEHTKLKTDMTRLLVLVKLLREEVPSEISLRAKKESESKGQRNEHSKYSNVRILNRAEQESRFATVTTQLHELEDIDSDDDEQDTDGDFGKLATYVNQGIHTNASQNQQRRANLLSHAKQGKYASKGIILEAVLQSESRNQSP